MVTIMNARTRTMLTGGVALVLACTILFSGLAVQAAEEMILTQTATRNVNAGEESQFRFRYQSRNSVRLAFKANASLTINMDVDAANIGDKDVSIEINCTGAVTMNMTCRETQAELGLMAGNVVQTRARNRYQYAYGFMTNISVNCTQFRARIAARVGNVQGHVWAYWNDTSSEWVEVPTELVGEDAVAEVDHFSTWTLLSPEAAIGIESTWITVLAIAAAGTVLLARKRRLH